MSRLCLTPQLGHIQLLVDSFKLSLRYPHVEQVLEEAKYRFTLISFLFSHSSL